MRYPRRPSPKLMLQTIGAKHRHWAQTPSLRLLPGNRVNTDTLIHDWLRLFNLDRSAMMQAQVETAADVAVPEKKEREHRPTRKAALSQEHSYDSTANEKKLLAEADKESKKNEDKKKSASGGEGVALIRTRRGRGRADAVVAFGAG